MKYLKNHAKCINILPEAINFYPTVGYSISLVFWKLDIQIFPGTLRSIQFESEKTFKYVCKARPKKAKTAEVSRGGRQPLNGRWQWPTHIVWPPEAKGSVFSYKCFQTPHFARKNRFWEFFWAYSLSSL